MLYSDRAQLSVRATPLPHFNTYQINPRSKLMFEKCTNCTTRVVVGRRDDNGVFCSTVCQSFYRYPGFCKSCHTATTEASAGSTYTLNGIGTTIYGGKDPCSECGSTVQTKWFVVLYIPLIPIGKYRTKWCSPNRYLSRKLIKVAR
jgi:hypothetical protein